MWNFWGCPSDFPEITVRYPQFFKLITSLNPRHALSHFRSHEALEDLEMTDEETDVAEDVGAAVGPDTATDKEAEKSDVTAEEAAAEDASPDHSHERVVDQF